MNLGETFLVDYYKRKGYLVKRTFFDFGRSHPDFVVEKNGKRIFIEEKMQGSDFRADQEKVVSELVKKGEKVWLARTILKEKIIRIFDLSELMERKFLFSLDIPNEIVPLRMSSCPKCHLPIIYKSNDMALKFKEHREVCNYES